MDKIQKFLEAIKVNHEEIMRDIHCWHHIDYLKVYDNKVGAIFRTQWYSVLLILLIAMLIKNNWNDFLKVTI